MKLQMGTIYTKPGYTNTVNWFPLEAKKTNSMRPSLKTRESN